MCSRNISYCNKKFSRALKKNMSSVVFKDALTCSGKHQTKLCFADLLLNKLVNLGNFETRSLGCEGDTGGPLMVQDVYPTVRYYQVGVVQDGRTLCGRDKDYPNVFVMIENPLALQFIRAVNRSDEIPCELW